MCTKENEAYGHINDLLNSLSLAYVLNCLESALMAAKQPRLCCAAANNSAQH